MKYDEAIYRSLCKIANKCKNYFYLHKYVDFDNFGKNQKVDEILAELNNLDKLRKEQKKEYE